ncbi:hypothetical protein LTR64_002883 [Lithohypha guttulata]|uniref:uncharacterized protein n=1 Tax=Lithohypha guttulata TaxID=1690604 RepID=UPI002DE03218|nr:hypothetical protein LTR51_000893 [Lithohypha guttulata]
MDAGSGGADSLTAPIPEQISENNHEDMAELSSDSIEDEYDESQCLFCNQTSPDLDQNLLHMSKAHGLHIDTTNLLVDVTSLLAYFHLIISAYYECLYCGTQRNTREAVQQHMIAKGHCKYDITDENAELRDFYDLSSADIRAEIQQNLAMRYSDDSQVLLQTRAKKARSSKQTDRPISNTTASPSSSTSQIPTQDAQTNAESSSHTTEPSSDPPGEVSTRVLKQESILNSQLAQLRADDRRSLLHLPASQQRALLATRHKQMEKARRAEQTQRGNLERAGNKFGRLGTVRLVRQPPHFGNVSGLNR